MAVKIVNAHLNDFEVNENDIWLHRYFPAKYLKDVITLTELNLRFTRLDLFSDGLEGWDLSIPNVKEALKESILFHNRVHEDGGVNEAPEIVSYHVLSRYSESDLIGESMKNRGSHYASCWFASNSQDDENRVMWKLYASPKGEDHVKDGVMISIKWVHLKMELEKLEAEFQCGYVNYDEKELSQNPMFQKEYSYMHEREFRILIRYKGSLDKWQRDEYRIEEIINLERIDCKVWNSTSNLSTIERLKSLDFEEGDDKSLKRFFSYSQLIPEKVSPIKVMRTYKEIQEEYKRVYRKSIRSCWIAHAKRDLGLTTRKAYNRINGNDVKNACKDTEVREKIKLLMYK